MCGLGRPGYSSCRGRVQTLAAFHLWHPLSISTVWCLRSFDVFAEHRYEPGCVRSMSSKGQDMRVYLVVARKFSHSLAAAISHCCATLYQLCATPILLRMGRRPHSVTDRWLYIRTSVSVAYDRLAVLRGPGHVTLGPHSPRSRVNLVVSKGVVLDPIVRYSLFNRAGQTRYFCNPMKQQACFGSGF